MSERHSPVETIQEARLAEISDALESAPPQEIVRWAVETYRDQLTVATAFGAEGCCLMAMIAQVRDKTGLTPAIFTINPLAHWKKTQVWDYIQRHTVPINPLHAQGYPSIGCWPCTRPTGAGEDDRAGRWAGTMKRECGLHL